MSLTFVFDPALNQNERNVCYAYWQYEYNGEPLNYIKHIQYLCNSFGISRQMLFQTVLSCQVYLTTTQCEYCGLPSKVDVPADIPFMRAQKNWFCHACMHFMGGEFFVAK